MRFLSHLPVLAALAGTIAPSAAQPQKQLARSPRIQSAKSVYFEDKTGVDAVGNKALAQLKRWGRFQIVKDRKQADLIFILDRKSTRLNSSHSQISYAVFCLK